MTELDNDNIDNSDLDIKNEDSMPSVTNDESNAIASESTMQIVDSCSNDTDNCDEQVDTIDEKLSNSDIEICDDDTDAKDQNPSDADFDKEADSIDDGASIKDYERAIFEEFSKVNRAPYKYEIIDFDSLMKKKKFSLFFIRCFDIFASLLGIIFLSPLFLIVAIVVASTSKGGVFFRQVRVGKNAKEFKIIKFRTMVVNSPKKGALLTVGADCRVTKVGKFLRKAKIDELPQLFNVLVGQMSFVGYRPQVPYFVEMYTDYERNVFRVKPGITDLASIMYRNESEVLAEADDYETTYINEIMPQKLALNMEGMKRMSLWFDLCIIFKTLLVVLK